MFFYWDDFISVEHEQLKHACAYPVGAGDIQYVKRLKAELQPLIEKKWIDFQSQGSHWGMKLTRIGRKEFVKMERLKGRFWNGQMQ